MTMPRIKTAAGAIACDKVLLTEAIVLNSIDMTRVNIKEISRKKKKFPGCLLRFVMKYNVMLKVMALRIL